MRQPISLGAKEMRELRRDPKCPNCGSKDIRLDKILNPENPLPKFRKFPIYKCGECGYWTPFTDKWTWHPPRYALEGFPYEELMGGTEYGSRLNVDKVPCFQCNEFDPYLDGASWRPCDKRLNFCWKYGRGMCRHYSVPKTTSSRGSTNSGGGLMPVAGRESDVKASDASSIIGSIIIEFTKKYEWHYKCNKDTSNSPQENINSGLCDLFAEEVKKRIPETIIHYDEDLDHCYCEIQNTFYDAENPKGVPRKEEMIFLGKLLR